MINITFNSEIKTFIDNMAYKSSNSFDFIE